MSKNRGRHLPPPGLGCTCGAGSRGQARGSVVQGDSGSTPLLNPGQILDYSCSGLMNPFVNPTLIRQMIDRFYESKKLIVIPRFRGRRGHPILFSSRLFSEILNALLDQGAKSVVHAHRDETLEIETEDEGIIIEIDTPEEYRQHGGRE